MVYTRVHYADTSRTALNPKGPIDMPRQVTLARRLSPSWSMGLGYAILCAACAPDSGNGPPDSGNGPGTNVEAASPNLVTLREVSRLPLHPAPGADILSVSNVDVSGTGRLLVTDQDQRSLWLFNPQGEMVGPDVSSAAPFNDPFDAVFLDEGRIVVADFPPRILVMRTSDLQVERSFDLSQDTPSPRIHLGDSVVVVEKTDTHNPGAAFAEYAYDGRILREFHHEVEHVTRLPSYWEAAGYHHHLAVGAGYYFVAPSMGYPLHRYDARTLAHSVFEVPPSGYRTPREPERGEFTPDAAGRAAFERFLREFTLTSSTWVVADSLLLVERRELDPDELGYRKASYQADIYHAETFTRLAEGIPLSGPVRFAADRVAVLADGPPQAPWTLQWLVVEPEEAP